MPAVCNPYRSTSGTSDTLPFVGRGPLVDDLVQAIEHHVDDPLGHVAIVGGGPGSGKSALLAELRARIDETPGLRAAFFDPAPLVAERVDVAVLALAECIAAALGVPAPDLGPWPEDQLVSAWLPHLLDARGSDTRLVLLVDSYPLIDDPRVRSTAGALLPLLGGIVERLAGRVALVAAYDLRSAAAEGALRKLLPNAQQQVLGSLDLAAAWSLVRISQVDRSLMWSNEAVDALLERSGAHPLVTQALCAAVWDAATRAGPATAPTATVAQVHAAVSSALEQLGGHFFAVWTGLSPAARLVLGLLAWSERAACSTPSLAGLLHSRGLRDPGWALLEQAPAELRRQGILEADAALLRMSVPLLRVWIRTRLPVDELMGELDRLHPEADARYQAAAQRWQAAATAEERAAAAEAVRAVLAVHPDHTGALEMLAAVHLHARDRASALPWLERLYALRPLRAGPYLADTLVGLAAATLQASERRRLLDRALHVVPGHAEAQRLLDAARNSVRGGAPPIAWAIGATSAGGGAKPSAVATDPAGLDRPTEAAQALVLVRGADADAHTDHAVPLGVREPGVRDGHQALALARQTALVSADAQQIDRTARLATAYEAGLAALQVGDVVEAQKQLGFVAGLSPSYREVSRHLHRAVTGHDPVQLAAEARGRVSAGLFGSALALAAACALAWVAGVPAPGASPTARPAAEVELQVEALQRSPASIAAPDPRTAAVGVAEDAPEASVPVQLGTPTTALSSTTSPTAPAAAPAGAPVVDATRPLRALLRQGWADIDRRDLRSAEAAFDAAVRQQPDSPEAWYGVGFVAELGQRPAQAAQAYCTARARGAHRAALLRDVDARMGRLGLDCPAP